MKHRLALCTAFALAPSAASAETAIKTVSCYDASYAMAFYEECVGYNGAAYCASQKPAVSRCWDFEPFTPSYIGAPWTMSGTAFQRQPTVGDNVAAHRVLQWTSSPLGSGSVFADLSSIGGDYWNTPYPIGNQGAAWIGTYEDRDSTSTPWASTRGDGPTGVATSPEFTIDRDYISLLVGGGCDVNTELVQLQLWQPEQAFCYPRRGGGTTCATFPAYWYPAGSRTGTCSELMYRNFFDTRDLQGRKARLLIVDNSSGAWGHINVDHVVHTNEIPNDFGGQNQPLWGFADTHAHPGNHLSMKSLGTSAGDGYLFHGGAGTVTTNHTTLEGELGSCDGSGHNTRHGARKFMHDIEATSLGTAPAWPAGCRDHDHVLGPHCDYDSKHADITKPENEHWGGGVTSNSGMDLNGWPYWTTRVHQQMHLTWIQRAYRGGQRLMVAAAGNTEAIGAATRARHDGEYLSDYGVLRRFKNYMFDLASKNSTWMEIALTPADARRIVRANKLAIVLATEVDDLGSHCPGDLTSTADDESYDHGKTTTTEGLDPFNQVRNLTDARSCAIEADWKRRIDNLHKAGYRVIMPVHLSDNDLGGTAIYSSTFNSNTRFMTHRWIRALLSTAVQYVFPRQPDFLNQPDTWKAEELGWTELFGGIASLGSQPAYTIAPYAGSPVPYSYAQGYGHINQRMFTGPTACPSGYCGGGEWVIQQIKAHGMILDLAHLGELGRKQILGLGAASTTSPLAQSCDMADPACQATAYPAIVTHAGLRETMHAADYMGGGPNEAALTAEMIGRISAIGGTIGIGTTPVDVQSADTAAPGNSSPLLAQTVANNCAGSSKSFAQSYLYALRRMGGRGVTLGTDINGIEDRLNPRYGTQGCYARGNIPNAVMFAADGSLMTSSLSNVPYNYRRNILSFADGTAGIQRAAERSVPGLNYTHYAGVPPSGGRFATLSDPPGYRTNLIVENFAQAPWGAALTSISMTSLSSLPPLNASVTGNRTFDLNYDGLAHYGMLPDMLQDSRTVGMTQEQLGPMFQGAEALVQSWEKACRFPGALCN